MTSAKDGEHGRRQQHEGLQWDIRPKSGFGTIEVRVMDTPLSVDRAAAIACYIKTLARYLLLDKPLTLKEDDYLVHTFNRFEACRCCSRQVGDDRARTTFDVLLVRRDTLQ